MEKRLLFVKHLYRGVKREQEETWISFVLPTCQPLDVFIYQRRQPSSQNNVKYASSIEVLKDFDIIKGYEIGITIEEVLAEYVRLQNLHILPQDINKLLLRKYNGLSRLPEKFNLDQPVQEVLENLLSPGKGYLIIAKLKNANGLVKTEIADIATEIINERTPLTLGQFLRLPKEYLEQLYSVVAVEAALNEKDFAFAHQLESLNKELEYYDISNDQSDEAIARIAKINTMIEKSELTPSTSGPKL